METKAIQKARLRFHMEPAAELRNKNPLLDKGQQVFEADTFLGKLGDGVRRWNELPYASYVHPVLPGNKHVPTGGTVGQFLGWESDGAAKWVSIPLTYFGINATAAEINYLKNVTAPIQEQLNGKAPSGHAHAGVYEPALSKNSAFNKNFGVGAGTVCEGNDSRLSNARPASGGDADTVNGKHAGDLQNYNNLSNKPSSFPPSGHTHTRSQITDFPSSLPAAGGNADTVDGFHASPVAGAKNSIVTTDPNGYIMAGYINTNVSEENPAIGDFMVINSAKDGYMRKATLAHVKAQLGAMPPVAHYHDERYYTEAEVNNLLSGKVNTNDGRLSDARTPIAHTHDDRYYTEAEINTKLAGKVDTSDGRLSNARPASDVYAWAKSAIKPSYGLDEIVGKGILGLSYNADIVVNANGLSILGPYAYPGFLTSTYYATASSASAITIQKTGVYALFSDFHISDRGTDREFLEIYPDVNGVQKPRLFVPYRSNAANNQSVYTGTKILKLQKGDVVKIRINASVASFNIRIDAKTYFALYPISLD